MFKAHDQHGIANATRLNFAVEIFSPSENDTAASREDIDYDLELSQKAIGNLEQKVQFGASTEVQANYDAMKVAQDEPLNEKNAIQGFNRRFGELYAASGLRKNAARFALNWALISPVSNRIGQNLVSSTWYLTIRL